jgi:hypothetical protein
VEKGQKRKIVVACVLLKEAFVVEGFGPPLEQNTSAGNARRGIAQSVARQAVVAITTCTTPSSISPPDRACR